MIIYAHGRRGNKQWYSVEESVWQLLVCDMISLWPDIFAMGRRTVLRYWPGHRGGGKLVSPYTYGLRMWGPDDFVFVFLILISIARFKL